MNDSTKNKWPNFFIVGASKSGTTTLYLYLKKTPGVYMSPIKEPVFFAPSAYPFERFTAIKNKKEYLSLFKNAKSQKAIGEASSGYLTDPDSPKLIHDQIPNAKIIMMLRNPVERAFSYYLHNIRNRSETKNFREAIECEIQNLKDNTVHRFYLGGSMYYEAVKRYIEKFGRNQVKVLIFEEFITKELEYVKDVLNFLGIESEPPKSINELDNSFRVARNYLAQGIITNPPLLKFVRKMRIPQQRIQWLREKILEKKVSKPIMLPEDRKFLEEYFHNDVQKLKKLIGLEFPWPFTSQF